MGSGRREALGLTVGEVVDTPETKGRAWRVSALDVEVLPRIYDYLVAKAREGQTVSYGDLKADLALPHATNGLGRVLDLLAVACRHRLHQPSLAPLVVNGTTREVGAQFSGDDAEAQRRVAFAHPWP